MKNATKPNGETKRERQQATRESILAATLELARADGWQAVTMRRVAEHIAYRAPVIYEHFANKDDLLQAVQRGGFERLALAMESVGKANSDGLLHLADAYWRFARAEPELYLLMHGASSTLVDPRETLAGASRVGDVVQAQLVSWAAERNVELADGAGKVEVLWGLLHGMVSITLLDRIGGGPERAHQLLRQTVQELLQAWAGQATR